MTRSTEICYDIRYPEEHKRMLDDPWSIRHTGVYQQFYKEEAVSKWVIVQPSETLKVLIDQCVPEDPPFVPHVLVLSMASRNWRWCINYLEQQLSSMVCFCRDISAIPSFNQPPIHDDENCLMNIQSEKSCYYEAGQASQDNYSVEFADVQTLQHLQQRLFLFQLVLRSSLKICRGLLSQDQLGQHGGGASKPRVLWFREETKNYQLKFSNYLESVIFLSKTAQSISVTVCCPLF